MTMFSFKGETFGLDDFREEVFRETFRDMKEPVRESGIFLAAEIERALSRQARSAPGSFPGMVEGHLRDSIGWGWDDKTDVDVSIRYSNVSVAVGMGAGRKATHAVRASKAKGVNPFEYGYNFEFGGIGKGGRREPPRPFVRPMFELHEARVDEIIREAME